MSVTAGAFYSLGAALSWAVGSMFSVHPIKALGPLLFNTVRMTYVFVILAVASLYLGKFDLAQIDSRAGAFLFLSGIFGILLADTFLFWTVSRVGPRLAGLLFACNAPISAFIGFLFFREYLSIYSYAGMTFLFTGVLIAIAYRDQSSSNQWERTQGNIIGGVLIGIGSAAFQALGTVLAKPIIQDGFDPVFATTFRVFIGVIGLLIAAVYVKGAARTLAAFFVTGKTLAAILVSGILGVAIGMTFLLVALETAPIGLVAMLSATTPIMLLPILWFVSKKTPTPTAIFGAVLVVIGTGIILQ